MNKFLNNIRNGHVDFTRKYLGDKFSYGMVSIACNFSAILMIIFLCNNSIVIFAIPLMIMGLVVAKNGLSYDKIRIFAIMGYLSGIFLLLTHLWPIIFFVLFSSVGVV